jgi:preprotein translocase subunit SecA
MREVERRVILSVVDRKWREHLYEMDALRDGIGLRSVGQRDPLVEYQREGYESFRAMMGGVKEESVTYFFHLPVKSEEERLAEEAQQRQQAAQAPQGVADARAAAGISLGSSGGAAQVAEGAVRAQPQRTDDRDDAEDQDDRPDVGIEAPKEPTQVSYSSATTGGGSASYTVPGSAAAVPSPVPGDTKQRDDGTHVRQVAAGQTYMKSDDQFAGVGRNDPCPCGSGSKFKKCHGA